MYFFILEEINMRENKIASIFYTLGIIIIILGIIGSFILGIFAAKFFLIVLIVGSISSFVSGMMFIGFGEIIDLLQRNLNKQDLIINSINNQTLQSKVDSLKSSIKDSQSNNK